MFPAAPDSWASLIALLLQRGHRVRALVRAGSGRKAPPNCKIVIGDPRDAASFRAAVASADTFVQLVGVTHPNPSKGEQFRGIELNAALAGLSAARDGSTCDSSSKVGAKDLA